MSFCKATGLMDKGRILKIDGRYYREAQYKKNNKIRCNNIPIEEMFADFIGQNVRITIEVI